nr:lipopolysaccharide biosynthesis protein [Erwinia persicina]
MKWSALERLLSQGIQLIIMMVLARLLGPASFGLIGMLTIFLALSQVLIDSGFSSALIRKEHCTEKDFSTAFCFNIFLAFLCYLTLYFFAPRISDFYDQPALTDLARVLGLVILINGFGIVPRTILTINMDFKKQAKISIISILTSGSISVILAFHGYGVWVLVTQNLLNALINTVLLNFFTRWKPGFKPSRHSFNYLFGFGGKLLIAGLLEAFYNNLYQIVIGKKFDASHLGHYTQANQLSSVPAMTLTNVIQRVTYPMFSHIQKEADRMDRAYVLTMKIAALFIFPLMVGLAIIATPLLTLVLGDVWSPAGILVSILSIGYMLYPIHAINLNLLQVKGRSDLFLKLEIIKKLLATLLLVITIPYGIEVMCIGLVVHSYLSLFINSYYTGKLSSFSGIAQLKAILPVWIITICSAMMAFATMSTLTQNNLFQVAGMIIISPILYILFIYLFQKELFMIVLKIKKK